MRIIGRAIVGRAIVILKLSVNKLILENYFISSRAATF